MNKITLPAIMLPPTLKVAGDVTLKFSTRELSPDEVVNIIKFKNLEGWVLFSPNEITKDDIPKYQAEADTKTPSQRLRAVLFLVWKQNGGEGGFDNYYRTQMERMIDHYKNQLEGGRNYE